MRRHRRVQPCSSAVIVLAVLTMMMIAGCGRKGPPVAPQRQDIAPVGTLSVHLVGDMARLDWVHELPEHPARQITGYRVYRSAVQLTAAGCAGCPQLFEKAGQVSAAKRHGAVNGSYEQRLAPGYRYRFKVRALYADGGTGADSNVVAVDY